MKFPAYSKYKDSGVQWLGEVPEHWEVKRGRFAIQVNPSSPQMRKLEFDDEVSFVPMEAIQAYGGLRLDQTKHKGEVAGGYTEFQDNDIVVAKITPCFENGKGSLVTGLVNSVAYGTTELHVLRAGYYLDDRFLFFLTITDGFRKLGESEMYGAGGQKRVPPEFCKNFRLPLPPLTEQTAIADFLDRETGRIDTLVAKKRRLLALLEEKRTALISRTVTRGLPGDIAREFGLEPNTRFKDSGIDWLGEVPEKWEIRPIKYLVSTPVTDGPHETPEILIEGIPFVSAEAINYGKINFDKIRGCISKEDHLRFSKKYKPEKGDLFMVKSGATTGRVAMVETDLEFNIWSPLAAIRPNFQLATSIFIYHYLHSNEFQTAVQLNWSFGTQQNIGMGVIQNLAVPIPPKPEQTAIATYLDRETAKIDQLKQKIEEAIARLQEYRAALITAAVTGKIDVRNRAA